MISTKEMYNKLPDSWDAFKFGDYMKCLDIPITEDGSITENLDNTLKVISALTDVPVSELEGIKMPEITRMASKLSFMEKMPEKGKTSIKWKAITEVTYNDFLTFLTLQKDAVHGMADIVRQFSKDELTPEQINEMSVREVHSGFFMLRKYLLKYTRHLILREIIHLMRLSLKTLIRQKFKPKGKK